MQATDGAQQPPGARTAVAIGANIDPEANIAWALDRLAELVPLLAVSTFYQVPALGRPGQPDYLNGAALVRWDRSPEALKHGVLRPIEAALGRVRNGDKYAARCIDLDIVHMEGYVSADSELQLPAPDLRTRLFVAKPVHALWPECVLPDTGEALRTIVEQLEKTAGPLGPVHVFSAHIHTR